MGNVGEYTFFCLLVQPLIGSTAFQSTKVLDVGPHLYIIEIIFAHRGGYSHTAGIPAYFRFRIVLAQIACELVDLFRFGIPTHKTYAGDVIAIVAYKTVEHLWSERLAGVAPKIWAVAAGTVARAVGDVDGEGYLIGYFLEYHPCIDVFKHDNEWVLMSVHMDEQPVRDGYGLSCMSYSQATIFSLPA